MTITHQKRNSIYQNRNKPLGSNNLPTETDKPDNIMSNWVSFKPSECEEKSKFFEYQCSSGKNAFTAVCMTHWEDAGHRKIPVG